MQSFKENLAYIILGIGVIILLFFMFQLQGLIQANLLPGAAQPAVTLQIQTPAAAPTQEPPTPVPPTATPEPPTPVPPTDTPAAAPAVIPTAGYKVYGSSLIGAIHVGTIDDHGYNQAHHDGLQQAIQQVPGVRLVEASNVPESDQVTTEIDNMVQQGAKIIFVQSFGYLPFALKAAEKYPDVIFLHPGGHELRANLGTYWANNFEAMYLAGIAAGATSKTGRLGFITGFAIPNILASVNAFELGAQTVNPNAKTALIINSAWVDPAKEEAATNALANAGVDVVTMIVDSPTTVVKTAEARGIYSIGFHSRTLQQFAPKGWLTGVDYSWSNYYAQAIQEIRTGKWEAAHVRGGIESDMIQLAPFGPAVSDPTKTRINQARGDIISGKLKIFHGPITDNQGRERIKAGEDGGLELLDTTDWLVAGVTKFDSVEKGIDLGPLPVQPAVAVTQSVTATAAAAPTQAPVSAPVTQSVASVAPTVAPTQALPPTNTPLPDVDFLLGYLPNDQQCTMVTNILATLMQQNFGLTTRAVPFPDRAALFASVANVGEPLNEADIKPEDRAKWVDFTACAILPDDADFIRQYSGDLEVVGHTLAQADNKNWQFVSNSRDVAPLKAKSACFFRLLEENLNFGDLKFTEPDAAGWIANHADLVQSWTRCQ
ncbi:MAG: BMP family ABC transporter substrate-binding protein [Caldilineaceae bacterium]